MFVQGGQVGTTGLRSCACIEHFQTQIQAGLVCIDTFFFNKEWFTELTKLSCNN